MQDAKAQEILEEKKGEALGKNSHAEPFSSRTVATSGSIGVQKRR